MRQPRARWAWVVTVAVGLLLAGGSFQLDQAVGQWQHQHRWKNAPETSRAIKMATDWPLHVIIGLVLAAVAWRRGNSRWMRIFLAMIAAGVLAGGMGFALKVSVGRSRPSVKMERALPGPELRQNFQSFPSGHTAFSTGFFALLFMASWRWGLLCAPLPVFVGFSRIFLGAHYLSDVICAAVLGVFCAMVVAHLLLRDEQFDSVRQQQDGVRAV